jgi:hypothetical protein
VNAASAVDLATVDGQRLRVSTDTQSDIAGLATDSLLTTRWHSGRLQTGAESLIVDLGSPEKVIAVVFELGTFGSDFGRSLALDCREPAGPDGAEIDGRALTFERPRPAQVLPMSPPRSCRVLRIRQTGTTTDNFWSVAEIRVLVEAGSGLK